jgi:ribose transport system substrate-binding protein
MRRAWIAVFSSMALLLAACGGDDEAEDTQPATDEETSDETTEDEATEEPADEPDEATDDEELVVGIANFRLDSAYFILLEEAIRDEAGSLGHRVISTDAQQDAAKLASDVEDMIAQGVDGVVLQASPLETVPAVTEALDAAGIPLVLVNRRLPDDTYASWIGADNAAMGANAGEYIAERLGGEGRLVILSGGPEDNPVGNARREGVEDAVSGADVEVVRAPGFGDWTEDGGFSLMSDMLVSHDQIDAVFCENDGMCLGALRAIEDAGRADEMFLVGVDGLEEALEAIAAGGPYAGSALNDADAIGRRGLQHLVAVLGGESVERDVELPGPLITADNLDEYYNP